jgi:hypothetical protein
MDRRLADSHVDRGAPPPTRCRRGTDATVASLRLASAAEHRCRWADGSWKLSDYVFLDADGTADCGLLLLVLRAPGVKYASQVAGVATEQRLAEGFLIPLGQTEIEAQLTAFFRAEFRGHSYRPTTDWTPSRLDRLREILGGVRVWKTFPDPPAEDEPGSLSLDSSRLEELTEAWVPVQSAYGRAILLFKNSD